MELGWSGRTSFLILSMVPGSIKYRLAIQDVLAASSGFITGGENILFTALYLIHAYIWKYFRSFRVEIFHINTQELSINPI